MRRISLIVYLVLCICISCKPVEVDSLGTVAGIVRNSQTNELVMGAKVTMSPGGMSQVTDKDGVFSFEELASGEYTVSFTCEGYEDVSQKVTAKAGAVIGLQILMTPIQPKLAVSVNALNFGETNTTLSIDVSNAGKGTLEWSVSESIDWIECTPVSGQTGTTPTTVVVTASRAKLDQGNYSGTMVISSNGGSETVTVSISVNKIQLEVEPSELDFGTLTLSRQLALTNRGTGTLAYEVLSSNEWISLSKASGNITKTDYLTVIVSREGLSSGKYSGNIVFNTKNGSLSIPVKMEVSLNEKPTVTTEGVSNQGSTSAVLHGTVVSPGSSKITKYGFCWGEKDEPTISDFFSNLGDCSESREFESLITNLKSDTKYFFRAYAENNAGLAYGSTTLSFVTSGLPVAPGVLTGAVSDITSTTAKAKGNITSLGNVEKITHYGHVWSTSSQPTLQTGRKTDLGEATAVSSFSSDITGLDVATAYYIRAYAINEKGTSYGEEVTFKTLTSDPVVTTGKVTDIIHNAATCAGKIVTTGGQEISEKGVCWSTDPQPAATGQYVAATSGDKDYTCRITGLEKETQYYVRAYLKTSSGDYFYGSDVDFKTTKEVTLPVLRDVTTSNITVSGVTLESYITSDGNSTITDCGFCWSTTSEPTVEDETAKCDPQSVALGKTLMNLKEGTAYNVRAYAKNAMGTAYSATKTFSTLSVTKAEVSNPVVDNIGRTTAYAASTVVHSGNADVTEVGFCWATHSAPTTYDNKVTTSLSKAFSTKLTGLPSLSTVYVRSYAVNSKGTAYSEDVSFTTIDVDTDVWDGTVASQFSGGSGTESDPILISSGAELALMMNRVNSGTSYSGVHFLLTLNVNLSNIVWDGIGVSADFSGIFNGGNHLVSGVNAKYGFFGTCSGGTIKNVTVSGVSNNPGSGFDGGAGGLCVRLKSGLIENCTNKINVSASNYAGGIVSIILNDVNAVTIDKCSNYGTIKSTSSSSSSGGMIGYITYQGRYDLPRGDIMVNNSENYGTVVAIKYSGGILGGQNQPWTHKVYIKNVVNYGTMSASTKGGICGFWESGWTSHYPSDGSFNACCNNNSYGIVGSREQHDYHPTLSDNYWIFDIVNNIGQENEVCDEPGSGNYFTRTSTACYLKGDTSKDIVTLLNQWVDSQSEGGYYHWKYETRDGYACPVFDK